MRWVPEAGSPNHASWQKRRSSTGLKTSKTRYREELLEQLKSENAFLKESILSLRSMQAEKNEKIEKQTEKMEKMAETIAALRSKLGQFQARHRAQLRSEMMLPEMRGGGPLRESPVRSLFQNSPRRSAERSRSEQDEGSPLSDVNQFVNLSGIDADEFYAALARSLPN